MTSLNFILYNPCKTWCILNASLKLYFVSDKPKIQTKTIKKGVQTYKMSEEAKLLARMKDAERKRLARLLRPPKKRSEMTSEELNKVRASDKIRKQNERLRLTSQKKEIIKIKDRKRKKKEKFVIKEDKEYSEKEKKYLKQKKSNRKMKQKQRKCVILAEKERNNLNKLIFMRKQRLLQSEEEKIITRKKAREGMRIFRKEGPIREYLERNKKHVWAVKWRKVLSQNQKLKDLEDKKKQRKYQQKINLI